MEKELFMLQSETKAQIKDLEEKDELNKRIINDL